jgi:Tfp pilus assembly protein PilP
MGLAQNGPVSQQAKASADARQKQNSTVKAVPVKPAQPGKPAATKPEVTPASTPTAKPAVVAVSKPPVTKAAASQATTKPTSSSTSKPAAVSVQPKPVAVKQHSKSVATRPVAAKPVAIKPVAAARPAAAKTVSPVAVKSAAKEANKVKEAKPATKDAATGSVSVEKAPEPAKNEKAKTYSANGRRDPFVSPVVAQSAVGSGCSTGKRCLAVEQISLKGVVRSETGMIAVVVNALDKAYFLRENDPVFDGYVLKITGDSIVFKETVQDKLGKPFTKEVTKKLNTPAV